MRAEAPLQRQELPDGRAFWSVTRYRDACHVLGDHRDFTSERGSLLAQLGRPTRPPGRCSWPPIRRDTPSYAGR